MNDVNEDRREGSGRRENDSENIESGMIAVMQEHIDELEARLEEARARIEELEEAPEAVPVGDEALRGLASTYRTAVRNGHPDAPKHLEALLSALGA